MKDDARDVAEISQQLTALDVDSVSAERIARIARSGVARGLSPRRFIEPVLVALVTTSVLAWAVLKIVEMFR